MYRISTITLFIFISILGLLQATAFDYIGFSGIKPDFLLIAVVFFSLSCARDISIRSAIIAGLIKDITSACSLGSYTTAFLLIAIFLNFYQRRIYREVALAQAMASFASYVAMSLMVIGFSFISARGLMIYYPYFSIVFKGALYTGLLAPLVFFMFSRLLRIHLAPTYF